jgi:hypothetical protein
MVHPKIIVNIHGESTDNDAYKQINSKEISTISVVTFWQMGKNAFS